MRSSSFLSIFSLLFLLGGCAGYHVGAAKDPGFKTLYIENFKSDVDEPGLENLVSTTIIKEFQNDGTIRITDADHADVILRGKITSFALSPVRFARTNELTPTEASMTIGVKYNLTRKGETKPYLESQASGSTGFFMGSDLQNDKRQGVPLAAEKIGKQMVASLVEGW